MLTNDVAQLTAMVSQLGGLVETRYRATLDAFQSRDSEQAAAIRLGDKALNAMQREVDRYALQLLALQHPYALELRAVIVGVRIAGLLEQIGDLLVGIARRIESISLHPKLSQAIAIPNLAIAVQANLTQALDAFSHLRGDEAQRLLDADDEIDTQYHAIMKQIFAKMPEDASLLPGYVYLIQIAKNYENIGDSVVHIAQQTVFLIDGRYPA
jgi:phosphate transport system protein